jgi:hypothetical protein
MARRPSAVKAAARRFSKKAAQKLRKKNYAVLLWRWHDIALIPNMKRPFQ